MTEGEWIKRLIDQLMFMCFTPANGTQMIGRTQCVRVANAY